MPYVPHTPNEQRLMLETIGVKSLDDLFADIGPTLAPKSFDLPQGLSEGAVLEQIESLAAKNSADLVSFLGAGYYDHCIPSAVDALASRGEFYTAYTPYQAEASQGTLQAMFEYQTAICRLLDMDAANASVYDGGSAIFEAMMMAVRKTKRKKLVISEDLSPIHRIMLKSYTINLNLDLVTVPHLNGGPDTKALEKAFDDQTAAVVVQNPNFFGSVADYAGLFQTARDKGIITVISVNPVMQAILKTPGEMGADIAVAEGQALGMPLSFGGPYLGIMACTQKMVRQLPGRIAGKTVDGQGRTGYVLTLQAREQHIRRQKATSNICSNQALCAIRTLLYLCLLGPEGLKRTAELAVERGHYAADRLSAIPGVELLNKSPFANEFAVNLPIPAFQAMNRLIDKGFVPGFPLGRYYQGLDNALLVAVTEKHSRQDIGILAELMQGAL